MLLLTKILLYVQAGLTAIGVVASLWGEYLFLLVALVAFLSFLVTNYLLFYQEQAEIISK